MDRKQLEALRELIRCEISTSLSKFVGNADNAAHNAALAQQVYDELLSTVQLPTNNQNLSKGE